jgi:peptide/nickel transport system permease protein
MKNWQLLFPGKKTNAALQRIGRGGSDVKLWRMALQQFRKNKLAIWSFRFIIFLTIIALSADFLANEKPLICKYKDKVYFPVVREYLVDAGISRWPADLVNVDWKKLDYQWSIFPPIPYLPQNLDHVNEHSVSPFGKQQLPSGRWRHWMGTDELGRDVLAGMLYGTRIALSIGIVSMGLALLIGVFIGALAGFFGDDRLCISRARLIFNIIFGFLAFFYGLGSRSYILQDALASSFGAFFVQLIISLFIIVCVMTFGNLCCLPFKKILWMKKKINIPVDLLLSRFIEIMNSIPTLFLIISVSAIVTRPSIFVVMVIIGLTAWTGIARFTRAELLRIRNLEYIEAAKALGFTQFRILLKHAIPNALSPVLIALAFGIANSILVESVLSFLGIGVPAETITWGSLLSQAQQTPGAWWIAVFPGLAIFLTVTVYNLVGEGLTDALDPKLKK